MTSSPHVPRWSSTIAPAACRRSPPPRSPSRRVRRRRRDRQVGGPHRRGDVTRGGVDHRAEVAAGDRAGDARDVVLAAPDVEHRRLPVAQLEQVVLEVLAPDVEPREPRLQRDVVRRELVPARAGEPVPAGRERGQVERPLVQLDARRRDRLAQLRRRVVAAARAPARATRRRRARRVRARSRPRFACCMRDSSPMGAATRPRRWRQPTTPRRFSQVRPIRRLRANFSACTCAVRSPSARWPSRSPPAPTAVARPPCRRATAAPLTVGSRNYIIKADQIRCSTAKTRRQDLPRLAPQGPARVQPAATSPAAR